MCEFRTVLLGWYSLVVACLACPLQNNNVTHFSKNKPTHCTISVELGQVFYVLCHKIETALARYGNKALRIVNGTKYSEMHLSRYHVSLCVSSYW